MWAGTWVVPFSPGHASQKLLAQLPRGGGDPSFVSGVGGLGGRRWASGAFAERHRIWLREGQEPAVLPAPCHQWTLVRLTWLARTRGGPRAPDRFLGRRLVEGRQGRWGGASRQAVCCR